MKKYATSITLAFVSLLSSCSSLYLPNVPNTPMLSSKSELHASAHLTWKGNTSFNSAYAVTDHLGVLLNGSIMYRIRDQKDIKHNLIESGLGYFTTFGSDDSRIFEIYAGLGKGNSERLIRNDDRSSSSVDREETTFDKQFLQVNYSSKKEKSLNLFGARFPLNYGTALRISHVKMNNFSINGIAQELEDNIFLEPVFFTRMAISPTVQIQYTSGSNFGLKNRKFLTAGNSVLSIGLVINTGGQL